MSLGELRQSWHWLLYRHADGWYFDPSKSCLHPYTYPQKSHLHYHNLLEVPVQFFETFFWVF